MRSFTIPLVNDTKFDASRPMGNVAKGILGFIISATFLGFFEEVRDALFRCKDWLDGAIRKGEVFGEVPEFHRYQLLEARSVANWILTGQVNRDDWREVLDAENLASQFEKVYSTSDRKSLRLDLLFPVALLADAPWVIMGEAKMADDLGIPEKFLELTPRAYGYSSARSWDGLEAGKDDFFHLGRSVIRDNLDAWLVKGQYILAAKWICLVYTKLGNQSDARLALMASFNDLGK